MVERSQPSCSASSARGGGAPTRASSDTRSSQLTSAGVPPCPAPTVSGSALESARSSTRTCPPARGPPRDQSTRSRISHLVSRSVNSRGAPHLGARLVPLPPELRAPRGPLLRAACRVGAAALLAAALAPARGAAVPRRHHAREARPPLAHVGDRECTVGTWVGATVGRGGGRPGTIQSRAARRAAPPARRSLRGPCASASALRARGGASLRVRSCFQAQNVILVRRPRAPPRLGHHTAMAPTAHGFLLVGRPVSEREGAARQRLQGR